MREIEKIRRDEYGMIRGAESYREREIATDLLKKEYWDVETRLENDDVSVTVQYVDDKVGYYLLLDTDSLNAVYATRVENENEIKELAREFYELKTGDNNDA